MATGDPYTCCLGTIKNGSPCTRRKKRYTTQFQSTRKALSTEELKGRYTPDEEISTEEILCLEFCWQHVSQWHLLVRSLLLLSIRPFLQLENIIFEISRTSIAEKDSVTATTPGGRRRTGCFDRTQPSRPIISQNHVSHLVTATDNREARLF